MTNHSSNNPWSNRDLNQPDENIEEDLDLESHDVLPLDETEEAHEDSAVVELKAALEASQQQVLRAHAEMENVRRRMEQEAANSRKFAVERVVSDLIPILDGLEQALQNAPENDPMAKGVELTWTMLADTLTKHGIKMLNPVGEKFNPQLHEAMSMQPKPDVDANTVLVVFQKGYTLNERLIRPARVVVSTA